MGEHPIRVPRRRRHRGRAGGAETSGVRNGVAAIALSVRKQSGNQHIAVVDLITLRRRRAAAPAAGYSVDVVRDNSLQTGRPGRSARAPVVVPGLARWSSWLFLAACARRSIRAISIPVSIISRSAYDDRGFTLTS